LLTTRPWRCACRLPLPHGEQTKALRPDAEAFFIENPVSNRLTGLLATHPSMDDRVQALQRYASALDAGAASQAPPAR
jgi:predicted Zn-dependent protease